MGKEVMGRSLECGSHGCGSGLGTQCHPVAESMPRIFRRSWTLLEEARGLVSSRRRQHRLGCEEIEEESMDFSFTEEQLLIQQTFQEVLREGAQ